VAKKYSQITIETTFDTDNDTIVFLSAAKNALRRFTPTVLLAAYAKLASPIFTGTPQAPTMKFTTSPVVGYVAKCTNVDGSFSWQSEASAGAAALPANYVSGCTLSHGADTAHDIVVSAGKWRDATDAVDIALASAITKHFAATWAVGTGQGGMAIGEALPASGTIHLWLIKRSDTGVVDVMANNHATTGLTPTLPAGYDYKRRIGSYRTDGSNNILNGVYWGTGTNRTFMFNAPVRDVAASNPGSTAVTAPLSTPGGIKTQAQLMVTKVNATGNLWGIYVSSLDNTDLAPSLFSDAPLATISGAGMWHNTTVSILTNTSSQIRYRTSGSVSTSDWIVIVTNGWEDSL
jgi:hypothetical protein